MSWGIAPDTSACTLLRKRSPVPLLPLFTLLTKHKKTFPNKVGPCGQFRHDAEGRLLRATETGTPARPTVRARVCQLETQSGLIRVTSAEATLPAAAASTDLQPVITLQCSDSESDDGGETDEQSVADRGEETCERCVATPDDVAEAKARQFRHATVAPRGAPPTPDPRLLEWPTPNTNTPPGTVNLAYYLRPVKDYQSAA